MKNGKLGIGMIVGWHIHGADFADKTLSYPEAELIAIYDGDKTRGQRFADQYKVVLKDDIDSLIADPLIDAVIVCSATTQHASQIVQLALGGKHIYVEKAPFADMKGALAAQRVILEHNIHFVFSNPIQQRDTILAKQLLESGQFGKVTAMRMRSCHDNAINGTMPMQFYNRKESGGGALIDMGFKCLHTLHWFMGDPIEVEAVFSSFTELAKLNSIEDNASVVFRFQDNSIGTIETSWVTPRTNSALDIYCTKGSMRLKDKKVLVSLGGHSLEYWPESEYPDPPVHPLRQWIQDILQNTYESENDITEAVALTQLLGNSYASGYQEGTNTIRI